MNEFDDIKDTKGFDMSFRQGKMNPYFKISVSSLVVIVIHLQQNISFEQKFQLRGTFKWAGGKKYF